jgi:hypothetical protein
LLDKVKEELDGLNIKENMQKSESKTDCNEDLS